MNLSMRFALVVGLVCLKSSAANEAAVAANCPAEVTLSQVAKDCNKNTATNCPAACHNLVNAANTQSFPNCFKTLISAGASYGVSEEGLCHLITTPCKVNTLVGLKCPKPQQPRNHAFSFMFDMSPPSANQSAWKKADFELAIANALGAFWGDVSTTAPKAALGRALAAGDVTVQVYSKTKAEILTHSAEVKKPVFANNMETQLTAVGVSYAASADFAATGVQEPKETPPMAGYKVPRYDPSSAVKMLHGYSPMKKGTKWSADPDTKEGKEYLKNVGMVSALCLTVIFLFIIMYWIFLCAHNCGCCKKCCCYHKKALGGKTYSKLMLCIFYLITLIVMCSSIVGRNHFKDGLSTVGDVLTNTSNVFADLDKAANDLELASTKMQKSVDLTKTISPAPPAGTGCKDISAYDSFKDVGSSFGDAAKEAGSNFDGLSGNIMDMKKAFVDDGTPLLDKLILALVALVTLWAVFGFLGLMFGHRAPRIAGTCMNFGTILGLLLLIILAVLCTLELAAGVFLADFCYSDPLTSTSTAAKEYMGAENLDLVTFYLDCGNGKGDDVNPVTKPLVDAQSLSETSTLYFKQLGASGQCNDDTMKQVYGPGGSGAMTTAALDSMITSLSCQTINPLFVKFTHDGMCDSVVSGLFSMFQTHVSVVALMLLCLVHASFVRPYFKTDKAVAQNKVDPNLPALQGQSIDL